jgi:hypothetical protein
VIDSRGHGVINAEDVILSAILNDFSIDGKSAQEGWL